MAPNWRGLYARNFLRFLFCWRPVTPPRPRANWRRNFRSSSSLMGATCCWTSSPRFSARRDRSPGERGARESVEADPAKTRQLHARMHQVQSRHQPEEVDLDALDPACLETDDAPEIGFVAGAAIGRSEIRARPEIAADGVGRKRGVDFGNGAQDSGHEAVAVGAGPNPVVACVREAIVLHRRFDLRNQLLRLRSGDIGNDARRVAEPASVRSPAIGANGFAP